MVSIKFTTIDDFSSRPPAAPPVSAIHSGNAGDVIYSLPSVRALGIRHLYLNVYRDPNPLRHLTEENARALTPLLLAQHYIDRVTLVSSGVPLESVDPACIDVDYVLDRFRKQDALHLHLMHAHAQAVHAEIDANEPFLQVPEESAPAESPEVVLALTPRYRALTGEFLRDLTLYFDRILILAIPEEWRSVAGIPGRVHKCRDYLEMARSIRGAQLFIGNPGLASAIAEGLKVPRIVDLPLEPTNAFPIGPNGYVLPSGRLEFVDIAHRLCGHLPRLASLYSDLLRALQSQAARPILLAEVDPSQVTLQGGGFTSFSPEEHGIFLHPGTPECPPPQALFRGLALSGHNCLQADLSVDHPESAPIRFLFHLRDEQGVTILQDTREVQPAESFHWHATFPRTFAKATLEIATFLAPGAESPNYAWAWVRNAQLRII